MSDPCVLIIIQRNKETFRKDKKMFKVISENVIVASKAGEVMEITVPVSDFQSAVAWLRQDGFEILTFIY